MLSSNISILAFAKSIKKWVVSARKQPVFCFCKAQILVYLCPAIKKIGNIAEIL
jgi:hypothetical protein